MEREQHFEQQRQRIAIALNIDNTGPVKPRGGRTLLPLLPKRQGPSPCKGKPRPNAEVKRGRAGEIIRKRCGRCGKMLPASEYTRKRKTLMAMCRPCHAAYQREYWVRRKLNAERKK